MGTLDSRVLIAVTPLQLDAILGGPLEPVVIVGGVLALVGGLVARLWVNRRRNPFRTGIDRVADGSTDGADDRDESVEDRDDRDGTDPGGGPSPLLDVAVTRLSEGEFTRAVEAAYMHARAHLADEHHIDADGTHWDFYARCEEVGPNTDLDGVYALTSAFERAVYGTEAVDRADAEQAIELSVELTDGSESPLKDRGTT